MLLGGQGHGDTFVDALSDCFSFLLQIKCIRNNKSQLAMKILRYHKTALLNMLRIFKIR